MTDNHQIPGPVVDTKRLAATNEDLAATAAALSATVNNLAIAVTQEKKAREDALKAETTARQRDNKSTWKWLRRGGGFIAFDVIVTIAGLIGGVIMYSAIHQIENTQAQFCFFYQLILTNYDANSPARKTFRGGPLAFDNAYRGMYQGSIDLSCRGIKPPAIPPR